MEKFLIILIIFFSFEVNAGENIEYLPQWKFDKDPDAYLISDIYSQELTLMNEPSLWEISKTAEKEVYRFLYFPAFMETVCVRFEINSTGEVELYVKVADTNNESFREKILDSESIVRLKSDAQDIKRMLENINFWDFQTQYKKEDGWPSVNLDGSIWIFEGVKDDKYQIISFWSPKADDIFDFGMAFFSMADLKNWDTQ